MLYEINNKYYILVGNKYIEIDFSINKNDVNIVPNSSKYIEKSDKLKVKKHTFNDDFKEKLSKKNKVDSFESNNKYNNVNKTRYNR